MDATLKKLAVDSFFSIGSFTPYISKPYRFDVNDRFIEKPEPVNIYAQSISENLGSAFAEVNSLINDAVECCSDERK